MKEIQTVIEIYAPAERVWEVLTDFAADPQRNPFIRRAEGEIRAASASTSSRPSHATDVALAGLL